MKIIFLFCIALDLINAGSNLDVKPAVKDEGKFEEDSRDFRREVENDIKVVGEIKEDVLAKDKYNVNDRYEASDKINGGDKLKELDNIANLEDKVVVKRDVGLGDEYKVGDEIVVGGIKMKRKVGVKGGDKMGRSAQMVKRDVGLGDESKVGDEIVVGGIKMKRKDGVKGRDKMERSAQMVKRDVGLGDESKVGDEIVVGGIKMKRKDGVKGGDKIGRSAQMVNNAGVGNGNFGRNGVKEEVCETEFCQDAATTILEGLDQSIDPCTNFYHFACNGYINKHKNDGDDDLLVSPLSLLEKDLTAMAYKFLDAIDSEEEEVEAIAMLKTFYSTCIEAQNIVLEPFHLFKIRRELSKYGLLPDESQNRRPFEWEKILAHMHILGSTHLFTIEYDTTPQTRYKLVGKVLSKVPKDYFIIYAINLITLLNIPNAEKIAMDALGIQILLFKIGENVGKNNMMLHNHEMLNLKFPKLNWTRLFEQIFKMSEYKDRGIEILQMSIVNEEYFHQLFALLEETSIESLKNYLLVNLLFRWSHFCANDAKLKMANVQVTNQLFKFLIKPPQEECLNELNQGLEAALLAQYIKQNFPVQKKIEIEKYLIGIVNTFKSRIDHQDWMDADTREMVKAKLDNTTIIVGYPDYFFEELENEFATVNIIDGDHLHNIYEIRKYYVRRMFKTINSTSEYFWIWEYSPLTVNAFNIRNPNLIKVHVGLVNRPLFDINRPKYLNYGGIGMLLGHEVSHGYDNYGIVFKVHNSTDFTWPPYMKTKFFERAQCLKDQYRGYIFEDLLLPVTWKKNYGFHDDISDVLGLQNAYLAYENFVSQNGEEPKLTKLNYSNRQLFFIQFAQLFCTSYKKPWILTPVKESTYSPGEFRVIGPIQNHPQFGKIFNCPVDSPMNPAKKCHLYV